MFLKEVTPPGLLYYKTYWSDGFYTFLDYSTSWYITLILDLLVIVLVAFSIRFLMLESAIEMGQKHEHKWWKPS